MKEMDKVELTFLMKDILKVLSNRVDENAFVGGECLRDWDQGRRPTSIDLFFYIKEDKTFEEVKELLELHFVESGFEIHFSGEGESNGKFDNIPSIERVVNATVDGWCLQFVQLNVSKSPTEFAEIFPLSSSGIFGRYSRGRCGLEFYKTPHYGLGEAFKCVYKLCDTHKNDSPYISQLKSRLPNYKYFDSEEGFLDYVTNNFDSIVEKW